MQTKVWAPLVGCHHSDQKLKTLVMTTVFFKLTLKKRQIDGLHKIKLSPNAKKKKYYVREET